MGKGGRQSSIETAAGVGTNVTGGYSAGGGPMAAFIDKGEQERRNQRIYGYDKSVEEYEKMRKGGATGDKVGTALGAGSEAQYIRPEQERTTQDEIKITTQGTKQGIKEAYKEMGIGWGNLPMSGGTFGNNELMKFKVKD